MATVSRSTKISGGTTLAASTLARATDVETDMLTLFNAHNNHDSGTSVWTVVNATLAKVADGTVGAPSLCFTNGTTDGLYRIGTNNYGFATNGVKRMDLSTSALTMAVPIAMGTNKVTGVGNGTAAQDVAAYGQLKVLSYGSMSTTTTTTTSSSTYQSSNLTITTGALASASSKVLVVAAFSVNNASPANTSACLALFNGSTNLMAAIGELINDGNFSAATAQMPCTLVWIDSPASVSAQTYTVKIKSTSNANAVSVAANSSTCFMYYMELA